MDKTQKKTMENQEYYFRYPKSMFHLLGKEELEDVISLYESELSIREICRQNPKFPVASFSKDIPYKKTQEICPYCQGVVYEKRNKSKMSLASEYLTYCPNCKHENKETCKCPICSEREKRKEDKIREIRNEKESKYIDSLFSVAFCLEDLTHQDEFSLYAICSHYEKKEKQEETKEQEESVFDFFSLRNISDIDHGEVSPFLVGGKIEEFIEKRILKPRKGFADVRMAYFHQINDHYSLNLSLGLWELNLEYEGKKISFADFKKYISKKQTREDVRKLLFQDLYVRYISYAFDSYGATKFGLNLQSIDSSLLGNDFYPKFSLSKSFHLLCDLLQQASVYSHGNNIDDITLWSYIRNKKLKYIEKDVKTVSDFEPIPHMVPNTIDYHVLNFLNLPDNWFYLSPSRLFPSKTNQEG